MDRKSMATIYIPNAAGIKFISQWEWTGECWGEINKDNPADRRASNPDGDSKLLKRQRLTESQAEIISRDIGLEEIYIESARRRSYRDFGELTPNTGENES